MLSKVGSFNSGTGTATSTQEIEIGFQAKVIFFWWNGRTESSDTVGAAIHRRGFGVATATDARGCIDTRSVDAQGNAVSSSYMSPAACIINHTDTTINGAIDLSAIGATSFTLIVDNDMPVDLRVHYLALGGDDIVNAICGSTQANADGYYQVAGLGWQPNFVMLFGNRNYTAIPAGSNADGTFSIGMATSAANQVCLAAGTDDNSATMDAGAYNTDNQMYAGLLDTLGANIYSRVDFVSFDAGGFTTAVDTTAFQVSTYAFYVALNCTNVVVGNSLTRTDGNDIAISGLGWKPAAGMVISHCREENTSATLTRTDKTSIGAFTSETERVAHGVRDEDNVSDSNVATAVEYDAVYVHINDTADTIAGLMDVKSVDAGGVTFIMDDADPAQAYFGYVLFGPAEAEGTQVNISESGLGTDNITVEKRIFISDSGQGTDQANESIGLSQLDQGTGTDVVSLQASLSQSDTGNGSDDVSHQTSISLTDVGSASESLQITATSGNRYWVGGTGNWSDAAHHWSCESSGTPNAVYLPTSGCDVFIDANSGFGGGGTLTINVNATCKNFICSSGHTFNITGTSSRDIDCYGSFTLESGITPTFGSITFSANTLGNIITPAGIVFGVDAIYFEGSGEWILQGNLELTGYIQQDNGTFDANNYNVKVDGKVRIWSSLGNITLKMGSGTWEVFEYWDTSEFDLNIVTLDCGTSTIKFTGDNTFYTGGKTYYDIWCVAGFDFFKGTGGTTTTFHNLTLEPDPLKVGIGTDYLFEDGHTFIITNDFIASGESNNLLNFYNKDGLAQYYFSKSTGTVVSCDYLNLHDSNATGGAIWFAGSHSLDTSNNDGWIFADQASSFSISDNGAGLDLLSQLSALLSISETGTGIDSLSQLLASLLISDVGFGATVISTTTNTGHIEIDKQITGNENDAREKDDDTAFSYTTAVIQATSSTVTANRFNLGLRFTGISIPASATINHSYITINCLDVASDDPNVTIYGESQDNAPDFASNPDVNDRTKTSASVNWTQTGIGTSPIDSPDLTSIVQEMLNAGYLNSGVLTLLLEGKTDLNRSFIIYAYDGSPPLAAKLHIGYTIAGETKTITEVAIGIDLVSLLVSLASSDNAVGIDTPEIGASLGITDSVLGGDFLDLSALLSLADISSASELESIAQQLLKTICDYGIAIDSPELVGWLIDECGALFDSEGHPLTDGTVGAELYLFISVMLSILDNGTGIDTETLSAALSLFDVGIGNEALTLSASLVVSDAGLGTDAISVLTAAIILIQEIASASDNINIQAQLSTTETASGDEAINLQITFSLVDTSAGIDSPEVSASLEVADGALGGDFLDLFAGLNVSEIGVGIDNLSQLLASLSLSETGSASDLLQLLASLSVSDSGQGTDNITLFTEIIRIITDAGLGSDQVSISANLSLQDTGTGQDALVIQVSLQISDSALGTDTISVLVFTLKEITDLAFGIDGIDIAASLNIGETSHGIDDPAILALLDLLDSGAGLDTPDISASLTITDTSSATDIISILQAMLVLISDTGAGADAITNITATIPVSESSLGSDQIGQILASLLVIDLGAGVDTVVKYDSTSNILTIEFILNKPRITFALSKPTIWMDLDIPSISTKLKTHLQ